MRRTTTGWVAQRGDEDTWLVDDGREPDGIYVYWGGAYLSLQYAGVDGVDPYIKLPRDRDLLLALSAIFREAAER